jgi:hypothetical protein
LPSQCHRGQRTEKGKKNGETIMLRKEKKIKEEEENKSIIISSK